MTSIFTYIYNRYRIIVVRERNERKDFVVSILLGATNSGDNSLIVKGYLRFVVPYGVPKSIFS